MLIDDLNKFIADMDEETINRLHRGTTTFQEEGLLPESDNNDSNIIIEPCEGIINPPDALIGDISFPDENEPAENETED